MAKRRTTRAHTSQGLPLVEVMRYTDAGRFILIYKSRNGRKVLHDPTYANSQAARRAARTFYPQARIVRVS